MSFTELCRHSIETLSPLLASRQVSPVEVTQALLERIEAVNPLLNAYITILSEGALAEARQCEREILLGKYRGPLHGIPIALKDLYETQGVRTTAGSKILAEYVPPADATTVARLRAAGAILLGKTNLNEFAYGVTGTTSFFGPSRNPWDLQRMPGGSSGGSGAAVAADLCLAATGSDTGGSIRIPAAFCGIVGLKPTYGRVSCHGLIPLSWSLDHAGPMTKSVFDAAVMLGAMAGWDAHDPASVRKPVPDFITSFGDGVHGLKIGVDPAYAFEEVTNAVKSAVQAALEVLRGLGAEVIEVKLPKVTAGMDAALTILMSEAVAYHEAWLRTRPEDYQPEVRARLERGFAFRGSDYGRARRVQQQLSRDFELLFEQIDLVATPMCAIPAPAIETVEVEIGGQTVPVMSPITRFTRLFNLTRLPAISVPCGFSAEGLPIGLQLVGRAWDEATVLRAARDYEQATSWHSRHLL